MSLNIQSSVRANNFSFEIIEEAKKFCGRRIELRRLVDAGHKPTEVLEAHTQLMLENRNVMKGVLYEAKLTDKKIYLLGTCHARLIERGLDLPTDEDAASKFICSLIHPVVLDILNKSNLYVELDMKNPENLFNFQLLAIQENLIISEPLPRLERTQLIEDTGMKTCGCGLDIALMEQQYRNQKKVFSLETASDQIPSLRAHVNFQRKDSRNFYFSSEQTLEAIDAVQWGNLDSITELDKGTTEEIIIEYNKRNVKMTDQIFEKLSSDENNLFAIGVTHLAGEKGILSLLKERGVQLTQVSFE